MADENHERITILLQARDRDFARAMDRNNKLIARMSRDASRNTDTMSRRIDSNLSKVSASVMNFGKAFAGGLVGGVVAAAFSSFSTNIAGVIRGIAQVGDEAKRSGLGIEAFQEWKFVAEQNRIGVDQLVDGFKELNLRADEFIATGAGPAAEAFARLGLTGAALGEKLKDPSELMLEIVDRLEEMDKAAQIRIADEVFGGTAGERFVELLEQGDEGLRQTIARAYEVGAVMDREMIEKADELTRKYDEAKNRLNALWQVAVVEGVSAGQKVGEAWSWLNQPRADALGGIIDAFSAVADDVADGLTDADPFREFGPKLRDDAQAAANELMILVDALDAVGDVDSADALDQIIDRLQAVVDKVVAGADVTPELADELTAAATEANAVFENIDAIDGVSMEGAKSAIGGLIGVLSSAVTTARELAAAMPGPVNLGQTTGKGLTQDGIVLPGTPSAPWTSPRPAPAPQNVDFDPSGNNWGKGSKGGKSREDDFQRSLERTAQQIAALEAEAAAFIAVAAAGEEYAWSVDFARKKAELMVAAQQAGKEITPELAAEIDNLARAYADAGQAADQAADDFEKVRENAEHGAEAIGDIFTSVLTGAKSAREAVADLLMEIAKAEARKGFLMLAGAGGPLGSFFSGLGDILGGGRAGGGGVSAGVPYRVNENTPNSEIFVPSRSGAVLNVAQAKDALSGGGGVVELIVRQEPGVVAEIARNEANAAVSMGMNQVRREVPALVRNDQRRNG